MNVCVLFLLSGVPDDSSRWVTQLSIKYVCSLSQVLKLEQRQPENTNSWYRVNISVPNFVILLMILTFEFTNKCFMETWRVKTVQRLNLEGHMSFFRLMLIHPLVGLSTQQRPHKPGAANWEWKELLPVLPAPRKSSPDPERRSSSLDRQPPAGTDLWWLQGELQLLRSE